MLLVSRSICSRFLLRIHAKTSLLHRRPFFLALQPCTQPCEQRGSNVFFFFSSLDCCCCFGCVDCAFVCITLFHLTLLRLFIIFFSFFIIIMYCGASNCHHYSCLSCIVSSEIVDMHAFTYSMCISRIYARNAPIPCHTI